MRNNPLNTISLYSTWLYLLLLAIITYLAIDNTLPFVWMVFGVLTIVFFFFFTKKYSLLWSEISEKLFQERIFMTALLIRIGWVTFSYFFYLRLTGEPFEFAAADSRGYHFEAAWILDLFKKGDLDRISEYYNERVTDAGYPIYLTFIYSIFGKSIFIARIIKSFIGAFTVVLIYKLAKRSFGDQTARITGVLAMLYPNLIYYCGLHVKETEMVFLLVLFVERADFLLRKKELNLWLVAFVLFLNTLLYFFRAVLAYSAFISFVFALIFSRSEIYQLKRKLSILMAVLGTILFLYGGSYFAEAIQYWEDRFENQEVSLEHRSQTNKLANYGSAIIFAPFSLIAPFPTFVNIENQQNHMLMSGAFYIKNILAYFVLMAILLLALQKKLINHLFLLSILISYVVILSMSKYALVERFHMPALPFHIIFTAAGISMITKKTNQYFNYYLILIAVVIVGWNLFKLIGRGLI